MTTIARVSGWMAWKGEAPYDGVLETSERNILIGYDMIPLRGLDQTKQALAEKGIEIVAASAVVCPPELRHGFGVAISGVLALDSLSWPTTHRGGGVWQVSDPQGHPVLSFRAACGYLACRLERSAGEEAAEARPLLRFWYGWFGDLDYRDPSRPRDGRRRRTLERARAEAREVFGRVGAEMVPVRFERETAR